MTDPMTAGVPDGSTAFTVSPGEPALPNVGAAADTPSTEDADPTSHPEHAPVPLVAQARQRLSGVVEERKNAAADLVEDFARTIHSSGEQFAGQQDWIASAIQRGARELTTLATSLRERDARDLLGEVQSFARQRPGVFIGAALAAGFAVARIGKLVAESASRADLPSVPEFGHGR